MTPTDLPVHPAADLFPMMSPEELQEFAADIVKNGQRHPIVLQNGVLLYGRNRLAACKLAKVEPILMELPADEDGLQLHRERFQVVEFGGVIPCCNAGVLYSEAISSCPERVIFRFDVFGYCSRNGLVARVSSRVNAK
jgi:hypothetical protein